MSDQKPETLHLKSVVHRDENGDITKINVEEAKQPQFHTPAYDKLMKDGGIPRWLRRQAD